VGVVVVARLAALAEQERETAGVAFGDEDGGAAGGHVQGCSVHASFLARLDVSNNLKDCSFRLAFL
jgi:hypothetical protein